MEKSPLWLILQNVNFFQISEVNIISVSELATLFPDELDTLDEEDTHTKSHSSKSHLHWIRTTSNNIFHTGKILGMPINHDYTSSFASC